MKQKKQGRTPMNPEHLKGKPQLTNTARSGIHPSMIKKKG